MGGKKVSLFRVNSAHLHLTSSLKQVYIICHLLRVQNSRLAGQREDIYWIYSLLRSRVYRKRTNSLWLDFSWFFKLNGVFLVRDPQRFSGERLVKLRILDINIGLRISTSYGVIYNADIVGFCFSALNHDEGFNRFVCCGIRGCGRFTM